MTNSERWFNSTKGRIFLLLSGMAILELLLLFLFIDVPNPSPKGKIIFIFVAWFFSLLGPLTPILIFILLAFHFPHAVLLSPFFPFGTLLFISVAWALMKGIRAPLRISKSKKLGWYLSILCIILWYLCGLCGLSLLALGHSA